MKNKWLLAALGIVLALAIVVSTQQRPGIQAATIYYIDATGGNDLNDGRSEDRAWRTLGKVYSEFTNGTFSGGDSILFKRGETWTATNTARLRVRNVSGTSKETPLYIGAYGSGAKPIIDGEYTIGTAIVASGRHDDAPVDHVVVEGLSIKRSTTACAYLTSSKHWYFLNCDFDGAMQIRDTSSYIYIQNCDCTSTNTASPQSPIYIGNGDVQGDYSHHIYIRDSYIHDVAGIGPPPTWQVECIDVKTQTDHVYIERNILENADACITLRGNDHVVRDNVITNPNGTAGICGWYAPDGWGDYGNRWLIEGNLIHSVDDGYGIHIYGGDHTIRNNTIADCGRNAIWLSQTSSTEVKNNIYYDLGEYGLYSHTEIPDSGYNRYPQLAVNQLYLGGGEQDIAQACAVHGIECHSITSDPGFLDEVDYRIGTGSPCYQAGNNGSSIGYYEPGAPTPTPTAWYNECPVSPPTFVPYVQPTYVPEPTYTPEPVPTCRPTLVPNPTYTPLPTSTPYPTHTPHPTQPPESTKTPTPGPTDTPTPEPTATETAAPIPAGAYYVASNGDDSNPGTIDKPWRTISKANSVLQPGDTVHIRGGIYHESIHPVRSGTEGNYITFAAYPGEEVTLDQSGPTLLVLNGKSYVRIDGFILEANETSDWASMNPADHCILSNNIMRNATRDRHGLFVHGASYNIISGNTILNHGGESPTQAGGVDSLNVTGGSHHNIIEDNRFENGIHSVLYVGDSSYNVIRNNHFQNAWYRDTLINGGSRNLWEGNVFADAFQRLQGDENRRATGIQWNSREGVVRYNIFRHTEDAGLELSTWVGSPTGCTDNRIYHNVFYECGGAGLRVTNMEVVSGGNAGGNVLKNNILYKNWRDADLSQMFFSYGDGYNGLENNRFFYNDVIYEAAGADVIYHNGVGAHSLAWWETNHPDEFANNLEVDPKFMDEDNYDFRLQSDSPLIDAGNSLTKALGSGSGTQITVEDAKYFSDGFGIVDADWIKIGNQEPVQISSIDYDTNTITLTQSRNWNNNDPVYLYKDSMGNVVLFGSAPDIGAHEYAEGMARASTDINRGD